MTSRTANGFAARTPHTRKLVAVLLAFSAVVGAPAAIAQPLSDSAAYEVRAALADRVPADLRPFYAARGNRPLWVRGLAVLPAGLELLEKVASADLDGLSPRKFRAEELAAALRRARDASPENLVRAEILLSKTYVAYVKAMRAQPREAMLYESDALKPAVPTDSHALEVAAAAPDLTAFVHEMGWMHPLYQPMRQALALTRWDSRERRQIWLNLERIRALPANPADRYVLVDAAGARLWMYENGKPVDSMKVVVGKPDNPTPMMAGFIRYAIVNPYWNVPPDLVRSRIATNVVRSGLRYLHSGGYQVLSDWSSDAQVTDPSTIDWRAVADGRAKPPRVRQLPGGENFMGKVKFEFPNQLGIYLHDTPDKQLLREEHRAFSSGCVRLENASKLGRWLLRRPLPPNVRAPEQRIDLPELVPVYITYLTAAPENGTIAFRPDFYGRDGGAMAMGSR
jgi:L,D-transpeptidase YcbB